MSQEWQRDQYVISTDKERLDREVIHHFLNTSYWANGIPLETVQRAIEHSLTFGLYNGNEQIGFARVITDYATFAYLADVFVLKAFRGQGLGKWLLNVIVSHPNLQGLRRWMLVTRDAHGLYRQSGFTDTKTPERYMERLFPDVYKNASDGQ